MEAIQSDHRSYLYDVEWQALRVKLLGYWNKPHLVKRATKQISAYIMLAYNAMDQQETTRRLYRALNYYNAIRMGYSGQGLEGSEMDQMVVKIRDQVQTLYRAQIKKGHVLADWDWDLVKEHLEMYYLVQREVFNKIRVSLQRRMETAAKRGPTENRTELMHFLNLMEEVMNDEQKRQDEDIVESDRERFADERLEDEEDEDERDAREIRKSDEQTYNQIIKEGLGIL